MPREFGKAKMTGKKSRKMSEHEQVEEFLTELNHPLKREIKEVRSIVLGANDELTEQIKWNAPSFCYNNEDRLTFNLRGTESFKLIFHCGAKVKNDIQTGVLFDDKTGLLKWASYNRAILTLTDMDDVKAKEEKIINLVNKWIEVTKYINL